MPKKKKKKHSSPKYIGCTQGHQTTEKKGKETKKIPSHHLDPGQSTRTRI